MCSSSSAESSSSCRCGGCGCLYRGGQNKKSRTEYYGDAAHLSGIHAGAALALVTTLERFHLAILLGEHRLCIRPPSHSHSHSHSQANSRAYASHVRRHASDGTCGWYTLPLPLAENKDGLLVVLTQWVLSDWLSLQSRQDG